MKWDFFADIFCSKTDKYLIKVGRPEYGQYAAVFGCLLEGLER